MSEEAMLERIKELEERNKFLERVINRGNVGNSNAYTTIRLAIIEKVDKEFDVSKFEDWQRKWEAQKMQRQIMRDLKWDLHVRQISDFRAEHIEPAKEYIANYKIEK